MFMGFTDSDVKHVYVSLKSCNTLKEKEDGILFLC
jgi:hypothetical protein